MRRNYLQTKEEILGAGMSGLGEVRSTPPQRQKQERRGDGTLADYGDVPSGLELEILWLPWLRCAPLGRKSSSEFGRPSWAWNLWQA